MRKKPRICTWQESIPLPIDTLYSSFLSLLIYQLHTQRTMKVEKLAINQLGFLLVLNLRKGFRLLSKLFLGQGPSTFSCSNFLRRKMLCMQALLQSFLCSPILWHPLRFILQMSNGLALWQCQKQFTTLQSILKAHLYTTRAGSFRQIK